MILVNFRYIASKQRRKRSPGEANAKTKMSDTEVQDVEEATHDISLSDDDGDRAPPQDAAEEAEEPQQQEENEADDNDDATAADAAEPAVLSVSPSEEKDEHVDVSLSDDEPQPPADDDQEEQPAAESTKEENEQDDAALQHQEQEEAEEEEEKQQQKDEPATATSDEQAAAPSSPSSASTSTARAHKASVSSVSSQHKHKEKLDINVGSPKKVGEGMSSYIVYTVHTKTDMESYRPMDDITVEHRYSDFHNLFKLLVADHPGVIVPPPPPKDALSTGIGKFKSSTEDISPFLERRARALQRFMRKVAEHPILRHDDNVKTFLTTETKLAKPKTSTLSNIAQKLASYVESEEWFADTTQEVDVIEAQLKQLHTALQSLVTRRKELSGLMTAFAERFSALADSEEMETLSGAMHQLADVEAKVANLHAKQRDREFYDLTEVVTDYLLLVTAIRTAFQQRISAFKAWQTAESTLLKKKDLQATYTAKNKTEKLDQAARDVEAAETAVQEAKVVFDEISARIKQEYKRCNLLRARDMKTAVIRYAKKTAELEEKIETAWTNFLPKAKAIGQEA